MFLNQIVDSQIKSCMLDIRNAVHQFVKHRKQHNTREIRHH